MDEQKLAHAKALFLGKATGFQSFGDAGGEFWRDEDEYKRVAAMKAHEILGPFVSGAMTPTLNEEARGLCYSIFDLTNFLNWRDRLKFDELFQDDGGWLRFFSLMTDCLRESPGGPWRDKLRALLAWLGEKDCPANLTKMLPTYFLLLWDPATHFCMKPRVLDQFLTLIGEPKTGAGVPLTVETYDRILDVCRQLRAALSGWHPRDVMDVQGFAWIVGRAATPDAPPDRPKVVPPVVPVPAPVPRSPISLNIILAGPPGTGKTWKLLNEYMPRFEEEQVLAIEDYALDRVADLTWHAVMAVGLAMLGEPVKAAVLADSLPVRANARSLGRTSGVSAAVQARLQEHASLDCAGVKYANRLEPALFWKESDARWRLADEVVEQSGASSRGTPLRR